MIFLVIAVLLLAAWQFTLRVRRHGLLRVVKSIGVAAAAGLISGIFIGLGARLGMAAIVLANGSQPGFTLSGSLSVVLTFASYGIGLGIVYEGLFRRLLRRHGLAYGVVLTLCTWYPLAQAATQQLASQPSLISLAVISGLIVGLMWLPFGLTLEALLRRWENRRAAPAVVNAAA